MIWFGFGSAAYATNSEQNQQLAINNHQRFNKSKIANRQWARLTGAHKSEAISEVVVEYHVDKTKVSSRQTFGRVLYSHNGFGVPYDQSELAIFLRAQLSTPTGGCRETP